MLVLTLHRSSSQQNCYVSLTAYKVWPLECKLTEQTLRSGMKLPQEEANKYQPFKL